MEAWAEMANLRPRRIKQRAQRANFRPGKADLRHDQADLRPEEAYLRPDLGPERNGGQKDKRD